MTFGNFPARAPFTKLVSGMTELGSFSPVENVELAHAVINIVKRGTSAGTEQLRFHLYPSSDYATPHLSSSWVTLASILTALGFTGSQHFVARVRFDFQRGHLSTALRYYMAVETSGFTPVGDTYFIGIKSDLPDTVNTGNALAAQIRVVGYN